ncbi:MAG: hypothetical protein QXS20_06135 [Candidatus Thorarchaeota archaeon]
MPASECEDLMQRGEEMAKLGRNEDAMTLFRQAASCWEGWERFGRAADSYERAYEHAMLAGHHADAATTILRAASMWLRQGEHDRFELDCQIASEAYISAAESEKNPERLIDGAFCAIMGGDMELARQIIHAAAEGTRGRSRELINLALMLSEYQFGDADKYIEAAIKRKMTREGVEQVRTWFLYIFAGFVRTSLESELAVTLESLSISTGLDVGKIEDLVNRGIELGLIPAYLDQESHELIVESDRADIPSLARRKRPIMSSDLKDPGAWDIEFEEDD